MNGFVCASVCVFSRIKDSDKMYHNKICFTNCESQLTEISDDELLIGFNLS